MKEIFLNCSSIEELPDISNWNTGEVVDMMCLFQNCSSVKRIPNISNWNVHNLKSLSNIFYGCSSLFSLPDISNWKISSDIKPEDIIYNSEPNLLMTSSFLNSGSMRDNESIKISSYSFNKENSSSYLDVYNYQNNDYSGENNSSQDYYDKFYQIE